MSAQLNKIRSWRIYVRRAIIVNYYTGEKVIIYRMESFRTSEAIIRLSWYKILCDTGA